MHLVTPLAESPTQPKVIVPQLMLSREAWNRLRSYTNISTPNEINGFAYVQVFDGAFYVFDGDVFITKQEVTPGSVHVTGKSYARAIYQATVDGRPEEQLRLQWHSHGRGDAYHSITDMRTIESYAPTMGWFISLVLNDRGDVTARLDVFDPHRIGAQMEVFVFDSIDSELTATLQDQVAELVTVATPSPPVRTAKKTSRKKAGSKKTGPKQPRRQGTALVLT